MKYWLVLILLCAQQSLHAYSFLTHEQLIDLSWDWTIKPYIQRRYPHATAEDLERAHAYAYGGCAIQDVGYYPSGHRLFSDLTHYVRTGEFIEALFRQANNPDELAFAIGALSHYVGDTVGHPITVNPSVALQFPNLARRYGDNVSYAEDKHAHVQVEFAFDVNEVSKRRIAPAAYFRYVGLKVAIGSLSRAFLETYGLRFEDVLGQRRPAVRAYRFAIRNLLPRTAYAESLLHHKQFPEDEITPAFEILQQNLDKADFRKRWEPFRVQKPTLQTRLMAFVILITPKLGSLALLKIKGPTAETHERYVKGVNASTDTLRKFLATIRPFPHVDNSDLDTGAKVRPGGYPLTDDTYRKLVWQITKNPLAPVPIGLERDILDYYSNLAAPIRTKNDPKKWSELQKRLNVLRGMKTSGLTHEMLEEVPSEDTVR